MSRSAKWSLGPGRECLQGTELRKAVIIVGNGAIPPATPPRLRNRAAVRCRHVKIPIIVAYQERDDSSNVHHVIVFFINFEPGACIFVLRLDG